MSKQTSSGMAKVGLIIGLVAILLVVFLIFNQSNTDNQLTGEQLDNRQTAAEQNQEPVEELGSAEQPDTVEESSDEMMEKKMADNSDMAEEDMSETDSAMAKNGTYADYDPALLANAEDGTVLLFFHASWCPSCRSLDKSIENNLSDLPGDVTILQVNYDTATELKKKYGVTRQHTLVEVDANGNQVRTLTGLTNTLNQVLGQL